jgi:hypothetical protein
MEAMVKHWVLLFSLAALATGCGDLPPLPEAQSLDGGAPGIRPDGASQASDLPLDSAAIDGPRTAPVDVPGAVIDASDGRGIDGTGARPIDASDSASAPDTFEARPQDAGHDTVPDAPAVIVCPSGYADCDGDNLTCETAITTPEHCGGCKTACAAVANGMPACSDKRCVVKCTSPYQDCDGKYENGCEIPVGKSNSCNESGLASFSGDTPPCGTPHCGGATASGSVASFGTWHCSFCDHCHIFGNGGSWCLYSSNGKGNFSSDRCSSCCPVNDEEVCP